MRALLLLPGDDGGQTQLLRQIQATRDPEQRAFLLQTLADAMQRTVIADEQVFTPTPSSVRLPTKRSAA